MEGATMSTRKDKAAATTNFSSSMSISDRSLKFGKARNRWICVGASVSGEKSNAQ
jgi:hypothetical protein